MAGRLEFYDFNLEKDIVKTGREMLAASLGVNTGNLTIANFTAV